MNDFVRVAPFAEISEGEMRAYDLPWGRVAVTHVEHRVFAFGDECTGSGCALSEGGFDDRSAEVTCGSCESVFDAETGEPLAGPATDPLPTFQARVVDGWMELSSQQADGPG